MERACFLSQIGSPGLFLFKKFLKFPRRMSWIYVQQMRLCVPALTLVDCSLFSLLECTRTKSLQHMTDVSSKKEEEQRRGGVNLYRINPQLAHKCVLLHFRLNGLLSEATVEKVFKVHPRSSVDLWGQSASSQLTCFTLDCMVCVYYGAQSYKNYYETMTSLL